ncbi:MAG TPA: glycoside hydrolase family 15 protein [Solirubrobacteraceae bacterium]|nr:glycoside hydrolase family 15 protein [Solirubrobacteraceae bacterium]
MPLPIEDYALIGDTQTAALVGRDGSIDWLCLPRFDSPACFAALLGDESHGRWLVAPAGGVRRVERRYRPGTLVLETDFHTEDGVLQVVDSMPIRDEAPDVVRVARCLEGRVPVRMELVLRFDFGHIVPWVRRYEDSGLVAVAGPEAVHLIPGRPTRGKDLTTVAEFELDAGDDVAFVLTWFPSHEPVPDPVDGVAATEDTTRWWQEWSGRSEVSDLVQRSLITLKALTYAPTGGIVAAPTTSLPEQLGGVRNWDYRFCWVRDATLTLQSLLYGGYVDEARAWRDWLLRAVAGSPGEMQIMYGPAGERRLTELVLDWLPGYEGAAPVRIGNAAAAQFQLDVYGELMDAMHQARLGGLEPDEAAWRLQVALMNYLEGAWDEPDEGIWEVRGPRRHFTHSRVMCWVAFDRAVRTVEETGLDGAVDRWRAAREAVHREVCERAWDPDRRTFTQAYGERGLDAATLLIPTVGFLPPRDERVVGTIEAIQRDLCRDGFVLRYDTAMGDDGLPPGEGAFLPCTFWLVDDLILLGRHGEARELFERLTALCNDVGLLSEEYDPAARRLVGNFPQAFSHVGLVNSALNLDRAQATPAEARAQ